MATGDTVLSIPPQDFFPAASGSPTGGVDYANAMTPVGLVRGLGFPAGVTSTAYALKRLPANASLATGLTFKLLLAVDVLNPQPGEVSKVAKFGVNVGIVGATTAYYPVDATVLGTQATGTVTLASTAGSTHELSVAITAANAGSAAANTWVEIQIQRLGADAAETSKARVVLLGVTVLDT